jgi:hypothetical protein
MTTLHIALQDGFAGDSVAISLDGREIYRKEGVRTDLRISRADGIDVETSATASQVEVQARSHSASTSLDPAKTPYLAVNLDASGQPQLRASATPFAYL